MIGYFSHVNILTIVVLSIRLRAHSDSLFSYWFIQSLGTHYFELLLTNLIEKLILAIVRLAIVFFVFEPASAKFDDVFRPFINQRVNQRLEERVYIGSEILSNIIDLFLLFHLFLNNRS